MTDSEGTYPLNEPWGDSPQPRRTPWRLVTALIGIVVIAGGALFAIRSTSSGSGADSPEGAVKAMFTALEKRDVIGILEALDPGERDAIRQPVVDMADQLRRLDILDDGLDLNSVDGLSFSVEGLTTSAESLGDGVSAVSLTGGTITTRSDPGRLPLGDFTRKVAGEALEQAEPETETTRLGEDGPVVLAAVERDGGWYVSLGYSVAENVRRDAKKPLPRFGKGEPAVGAATPEGAVRDMIEATADLDVRRLVQLTPPDEMAALHDYAPLFLSDAEREMADVRRNLDVRITTLDLATASVSGGTLVKIRKLELEGAYDNGESGGTSFSYKGGCVDVKGADVEDETGTAHFCPSELAKSDLPVPFFSGVKGPDIHLDQPQLGFVTVQRDGKWFVSPIRTLLQGGVAVLEVFDRADLDALYTWFTVDLPKQTGSHESSTGVSAQFDIDGPVEITVPGDEETPIRLSPPPRP